MKLQPNDLEHIAARTLEHYEQRAQQFWEGTRDHDVSQNIAALPHYIEAPPPFELLDFGCGPGAAVCGRTQVDPTSHSALRKADDQRLT